MLISLGVKRFGRVISRISDPKCLNHPQAVVPRPESSILGTEAPRATSGAAMRSATGSAPKNTPGACIWVAIGWCYGVNRVGNHTIGGKWDQVGTILATDGHYRSNVHVLPSERSHLWELPPMHYHAAMA